MLEENKTLLKFNSEGIKPADMFLNARKVAIKAVDDFMKDKEEPMYCGFANVSIHPARGRFVKFLKDAGVGDNGYGGGYRISYYDIMPQDHQYRMTQSLDIKEIACEAFRDELRKYGMTVYAESRAD
jgi:hypothetical protein|tara:strand:- start:1102 stop:1482 length:381 start_codon:yes stop_codon:yes gene_type:complete